MGAEWETHARRRDPAQYRMHGFQHIFARPQRVWQAVGKVCLPTAGECTHTLFGAQRRPNSAGHDVSEKRIAYTLMRARTDGSCTLLKPAASYGTPYAVFSFAQTYMATMVAGPCERVGFNKPSVFAALWASHTRTLGMAPSRSRSGSLQEASGGGAIGWQAYRHQGVVLPGIALAGDCQRQGRAYFCKRVGVRSKGQVSRLMHPSHSCFPARLAVMCACQPRRRRRMTQGAARRPHRGGMTPGPDDSADS